MSGCTQAHHDHDDRMRTGGNDATMVTSSSLLESGEIHAFLELLAGSLRALGDNADSAVLTQLDKIVTDMRRLKDQSTLTSPETPPAAGASPPPDVTEELEAVVAITAQATNTILDAAEEIEATVRPLDGEAGNALRGIASRLCEACSFQDLTGQRIRRIVAVLQAAAQQTAGAGAEVYGTGSGGAGDGAQSQDDIDALLADFG